MKKREKKKAQKEEKMDKVAGNRLKSPNNVRELLDELNKIANIEYEKAPTQDEKGNLVPNYFYKEHYEADLDRFGDLNAVLLNDVKSAMKFDLTCLRYASQIPFAYTRKRSD